MRAAGCWCVLNVRVCVCVRERLAGMRECAGFHTGPHVRTHVMGMRDEPISIFVRATVCAMRACVCAGV